MVYIVLAPFSDNKHPWKIGIPLAVLASITLACYLLIYATFKRNVLAFYFIVSVSVFFVGWSLGLTTFLSHFSTILLSWRMTEAITGMTLKRLWSIIIVTSCISFLFAFIFDIFRPSFQYPYLFLVFLFVQILLAYTSYLLQSVRSLKPCRNLTLSIVLGVLAAGAVVTFFSLFSRYITAMIRFLIEAVALASFYIADVIMTVIKHFGADYFSASNRLHPQPSVKNSWKKADYETYVYQSSKLEWIGVALISVAAIVVFFLIRKRWLSREKNSFKQKVTVQAMFDVKSVKRRTLKRSYKAPKDPIRQLFFQLQMILRKSDYGRLKDETVGEWMERLPSEVVGKSAIRTAYEKVRYGKQRLKEKEIRHYRRSIELLFEKVAKEKKEKD